MMMMAENRRELNQRLNTFYFIWRFVTDTTKNTGYQIELKT